jgi:hypothetical protein
MKASFPVEAGNKGIKDGSLPKTIMDFVQKNKPEAAYFVSENGLRTSYFFFDLKDVSDIPSVVEPFFMNLNALVEVTPAMNVEDMRTGTAKAVRASEK